MKCKKHPEYKALHEPMVNCLDCWKQYAQKISDAAEFGERMANAIMDCRSSHAYWLVQQAYGDLDWDEVVRLCEQVTGKKWSRD